MSAFEPELGQMAFGQPWKHHACPPILDSALEAIRSELGRVLWNAYQDEWDPFGNRAEAFRAPNFGVWAYYWGEDVDQPYNFARPDMNIYLSWYKYMGRGVSINRDVTPDEAAELLEKCTSELRALEGREFDSDSRLKAECLVGGILEVPYFEKGQSA